MTVLTHPKALKTRSGELMLEGNIRAMQNHTPQTHHRLMSRESFRRIIRTIRGIFQKGMAISQLQEMHESNVQLVVPKPLHSAYPPYKKSSVRILTVSEFLETVSNRIF